MLKKRGKNPFFCSKSPKALDREDRGIWKKQRESLKTMYPSLKAPLTICSDIGSEESREGITSVVVFTHFDEDDLFFLMRNFEDDLVFVMHGKDDDLMVGEMTLKRRVQISF